MKAIVVDGPSGLWKSVVAYSLAKTLNSAVITADISQLFSKYDRLGTKPSAHMRSIVQYPLVDKYKATDFSTLDPFTIWRYRNDTMPVLRAMWEKNQIPVIEGGSLLYVKCLGYGKDDVNTTVIPLEMRRIAQSVVEKHRYNWEACVAHAKELFPTLKVNMRRNDFYRLEKEIIVQLSNRPRGEELFSTNPQFDMRIFYLDIDHSSVMQAIDRLAERAVEAGLVEETLNLILSGDFNVRESARKMPEKSLGYSDTFDYIKNLLSRLQTNQIQDHNLFDSFFQYIITLIINMKKLVKDREKMYRSMKKEIFCIPVQLDSFSRLSLNTIIPTIQKVTEWPRSAFDASKGVHDSFFDPQIHIESRIHWSRYGPDMRDNSLVAVKQHLRLIEKHRDQLVKLGL